MGPTIDSDTGAAEGEGGKTGRKKTERKRKRTHLGPKIKVRQEVVVTGES